MFIELLRRECLLAWRRPGEALTPLVFFLVTSMLFPLGLTPDPDLLRPLAPGLIWVIAFLAGMLGVQGLFRADYDDGSLEQLLLSPRPLTLAILAKALGHWLVTGLPIVCGAALVAEMLFVPPHVLAALVAGLALGTPILTLLGTLVSALTVGLRQAAVLAPVLILPLSVPVLIFGAHSALLAMHGQSTARAFVVLAGMLILALSLLPAAAALGLRIGHEA
ncbi:MAG: heme exporter protein CcmB [Gammaproteobacteria bacterium]|nr:heme exporter protein CcmB [Gammaproteobacteria bacterium]